MNTLILPLAFIFLAALLLWFLISARSPWYLKVITMALTLATAYCQWTTVNGYFGHPKAAVLESVDGRSGYLFWARVEEPNTISLWVRLDGDSEPEVYAFPYDREFHKLALQFIAKIIMNEGEPIRIQFAKQEEQKPGGGRPGQGKKGNLGPIGTDGAIDGPRMPYIQPSPTPPPKQ